MHLLFDIKNKKSAVEVCYKNNKFYDNLNCFSFAGKRYMFDKLFSPVVSSDSLKHILCDVTLLWSHAYYLLSSSSVLKYMYFAYSYTDDTKLE